MLVRDLKPGQWFEFDGRRYLMLRNMADKEFCLAYTGLDGYAGLASFSKHREVELLEGCDGWDWKKPEPVKKMPTWRPYTNAELRNQFAKSVVDRDGNPHLITDVAGGSVLIGVDWIGADELLAGYLFFIGGERCGVLE